MLGGFLANILTRNVFQYMSPPQKKNKGHVLPSTPSIIVTFLQTLSLVNLNEYSSLNMLFILGYAIFSSYQSMHYIDIQIHIFMHRFRIQTHAQT